MKTHKIARYITIAALFLIPIFPLIAFGSLTFPFITGKAFYFRVLVDIAFTGWVILAFLDAKYRPKMTALTIAVSAFALITLVANIVGVEPLRSFWSNLERMEGWITIIHLWALYMVMTNVFGQGEEGRKLWHKWLNFSLFVSAIVAVYGIFQLFGWTNIHKDVGRLDASFGNAEYLGVYMIFGVFLAIYMFIVTKSKAAISKKDMVKKTPYRWVYIALAVSFVVVTFGTQTRAAILGLIIGILLSVIIFAFFNNGESKKPRWIAGCLVGLMLLIGAIFWLNRSATFIQKSPLLSRFASISLTDASNQARLYIWPMALEGVVERPILGWGQENFSYVFQSHYNPAMYGHEQWFDRAHNVFLDWLINAGIIGLLSYLALYLLFGIYVWRSSMSTAEKSVLSGLLVAYTVNNLFVFDNLGSYVPFFAMLAYIDVSSSGRTIKCLGTNPAKEEFVNYVVIPISAVLLMVTVYFFSMRQFIVSVKLVNAVSTCGNTSVDIGAFRGAVDTNLYMTEQEVREQLYSCLVGAYWDADFTRDRKQEFAELAKREMADQIVSAPIDARGYYLIGLSLNQIGQIGDAEKYLSKAHELSPSRQIFSFELAADLIYMRKYDEALAILKETYDYAPHYVQAAKAYAIALQLTSNDAQARSVLSDDPLFNTTLSNVKTYAANNDPNKLFALFKGVTFVSADANIVIAQAQMEYTQGMVQQAIQTLLILGNIHPELKVGVDSMIKQMSR
ncbi:MAG: O-antigen ligase family protein [Candidatus Taylorbacteria bacterium]